MNLESISAVISHQFAGVDEVTDIWFEGHSPSVGVKVKMAGGSFVNLQLSVVLADDDGNDWPPPNRVMFLTGESGVKCQGCVAGSESGGSKVTDDDLKCDVCGFTNVK